DKCRRRSAARKADAPKKIDLLGSGARAEGRIAKELAQSRLFGVGPLREFFTKSESADAAAAQFHLQREIFEIEIPPLDERIDEEREVAERRTGIDVQVTDS